MEFYAKQPQMRALMDMVDPKAVERVLRVLDTTGAAIVLSSTWRHIPELIDRLAQSGLPLTGRATPSLDLNTT